MTIQQLPPTTAPNLPIAPQSYTARYLDQLTNVLRLYFAQVDARLQQLLVGFNHYGVFYEDTTQTAASTGVAYPVAIATTVEASGVSVINTSEVLAARSGVYRASFVVSVEKGTAGDATAWFWFRVDGDDVAQSAVEVPITGAGGPQVVVREFLGMLVAGSVLQLMWATDSTAVELPAAVAAAPVPARASAHAAVTYVYPAGA